MYRRSLLLGAGATLLASTPALSQVRTSVPRDNPGPMAPNAVIGPAAPATPGLHDMTGYMRTDIFVFCDTYAVSQATGGKLPSEYGKEVLDLWRAGKVRTMNTWVTVRFSGFIRKDG